MERDRHNYVRSKQLGLLSHDPGQPLGEPFRQGIELVEFQLNHRPHHVAVIRSVTSRDIELVHLPAAEMTQGLRHLGGYRRDKRPAALLAERTRERAKLLKTLPTNREPAGRGQHLSAQAARRGKKQRRERIEREAKQNGTPSREAWQ
jgi:hypothetical protein